MRDTNLVSFFTEVCSFIAALANIYLFKVKIKNAEKDVKYVRS